MPLYRILSGSWYVNNPDASGKIMKNPGDVIELNSPIADINKDKLQLVSDKSSAKNIKTDSGDKDTTSEKQPLKTGAANPGPAPVKP